VDFLREFRKQIVYMHCAISYPMVNGPNRWRRNVNFKEIGDVLREIHFEGDATIELAHENGFVRTRPLKESLKMSRDFMRKTMGI